MSNERPEPKFETQMITCPKCNGTGKISVPGGVREAQCQTCKGKGKIPA